MQTVVNEQILQIEAVMRALQIVSASEESMDAIKTTRERLLKASPDSIVDAICNAIYIFELCQKRAESNGNEFLVNAYGGVIFMLNTTINGCVQEA